MGYFRSLRQPASGLAYQGNDDKIYLTTDGVLFCCQRKYLPRSNYHVHVKYKEEYGVETRGKELFGSVLFLYYELYELLKPAFSRRF